MAADETRAEKYHVRAYCDTGEYVTRMVAATSAEEASNKLARRLPDFSRVDDVWLDSDWNTSAWGVEQAAEEERAR